MQSNSYLKHQVAAERLRGGFSAFTRASEREHGCPPPPSDTWDLNAAGLADRQIRLFGNSWVLSGTGSPVVLGSTSGAGMRIVRNGKAYLLVGGNGHASVLSAIRAAEGGETILIAPGTYREEEPFVIDRPVTLQGVSEQGIPVVGRSEIGHL